MQQNVQRLEASVLNIQVDNQMLQAQCPVVVFVPSFVRTEDISACIPVIEITAERVISTNHNIDTIKVCFGFCFLILFILLLNFFRTQQL